MLVFFPLQVVRTHTSPLEHGSHTTVSILGRVGIGKSYSRLRWVVKFHLHPTLFVTIFFFLLSAEKYCRLLREENGFEILEKLVARTTDEKVRRFAKNALDGSIEYLERNAVLGDEHSDDLEGWRKFAFFSRQRFSFFFFLISSCTLAVCMIIIDKRF